MRLPVSGIPLFPSLYDFFLGVSGCDVNRVSRHPNGKEADVVACRAFEQIISSLFIHSFREAVSCRRSKIQASHTSQSAYAPNNVHSLFICTLVPREDFVFRDDGEFINQEASELNWIVR